MELYLLQIVRSRKASNKLKVIIVGHLLSSKMCIYYGLHEQKLVSYQQARHAELPVFDIFLCFKIQHKA